VSDTGRTEPARSRPSVSSCSSEARSDARGVP
jgi:hypothetical protein